MRRNVSVTNSETLTAYERKGHLYLPTQRTTKQVSYFYSGTYSEIIFTVFKAIIIIFLVNVCIVGIESDKITIHSIINQFKPFLNTLQNFQFSSIIEYITIPKVSSVIPASEVINLLISILNSFTFIIGYIVQLITLIISFVGCCLGISL